MKTIFFSSNFNILEEWEKRDSNNTISVVSDIESLENKNNLDDSIVVADYDSVAHDINTLISSNTIPKHLVVLESVPEIVTGKMLIAHGIKAYGNSRMLSIHYKQMIQTIKNKKVWTYPELTAALVHSAKRNKLNNDSINLIENRLTQKEQEVVYLVIEGYTNDAIASELEITVRTVKAHVSSIFSKLHVNDRIALVLLLK